MRRLAILSLSVLLAIPALASDDIIRRGFNVEEGGTLRLDVNLGAIKVVSGGNGVAVEVVRKASGRSAERKMREHRITLVQQGNDVVIRAEGERIHFSFFDWDDYEVQWNIRVPARYNLDLRTSGGSIDLADIGGTVEARTSGGSIKTGKLAGNAVLKTSGGSIRIAGGSADVEARSSGGSIDIGDVTGRVDATTSGGSIRLTKIGGQLRAYSSGGGIKIEDAGGVIDASTSGGSIVATLTRPLSDDSVLSTSGGGVTVSIAASMKLDLDARTSGGSVRTEIPVTVHRTDGDNSLRGEINGGGPTLKLRSSGGGIHVRAL